MNSRSVWALPACALALAVAGCGSTTTTSSPSQPGGSGVTPGAPVGRSTHRRLALDNAPALEPYTASIYSARRPVAWVTEADEKQHTGFTETRWRDPNDPSTAVLIDVSAGDNTPPAQKAAAVRQAATTTSSAYFGATLISGKHGWKWIFDTPGHRRVDYFFNDCGATFAVLGSTTPARFASLAPTFSKIVESIHCFNQTSPPTPPPAATPTPSPTPSPGPVPSSGCGQADNNSPPCDPSNPPANFCDTHNCIPNYPNGNGFAVQCNDGTWSHSGGIQGACSSHGGESGSP